MPQIKTEVNKKILENTFRVNIVNVTKINI